jgi:hypothetical protein
MGDGVSMYEVHERAHRRVPRGGRRRIRYLLECREEPDEFTSVVERGHAVAERQHPAHEIGGDRWVLRTRWQQRIPLPLARMSRGEQRASGDSMLDGQWHEVETHPWDGTREVFLRRRRRAGR